MKKINQNGFHVIELIIVIAVLGAIGFIGFKVVGKQTSSNSSKTDSKADASGLVSSMDLECLPRGHDYYRTNSALTVDTKDADTVYVGVEYKGVFKSTDGGTTWKQSDNGIRGYAKEGDKTQKCVQELGRMISDPKDNKHLLVTRVESPGDLSTRFSENAGVWESFDAGKTWKQMIKPGMNASGSQAIAFDTKDSKIIYHGTNQMHPSYTDGNGNAVSKKYFNKDGILYKTTNGGNSWSELPTGANPGFRAVSVAVDPNNNSKLWLFTFSASEDGGDVPESQQKAMLVSSDSGKTWQSLADKLPSGYRALTNGQLSPKDSGNAFVITMNRTGAQKSFATIDGGNTWKESSTYIFAADFDSNDQSGNRLLGYAPYANKPGIYESKDGGLTWTYLSALPSEVDGKSNFGVRISSFAWSETEKETVYMSGSGGYVWKSTDNGKSWKTVLTLDKIGGPNKNKEGTTKSREQDPN